jgi:hypothetical protein
MKLFSDESDEHTCVHDVFANSSVSLVRLIVNEFVNIRLYSMAKRFTETIRG